MELRELDALIAEKVMGYQCVCNEPPGRIDCPIHCYEDRRTLLPYSSSIERAWPVAEKKKIALIPLSDGRWWAQAQGDHAFDPKLSEWFETKFSDQHDGVADSPALAICLAALKELEIEVSE